MNNIKTVEGSQPLNTPGQGAAANQATKAAKPATAEGKVLPESVPVADVTSQQKQQRAAQASAELAREQRVEQAVAQLNDYVQSLQRDLRFTVDDDLGRAIVHVVDRNTQEVIRQIPNETALRLARNLKDIQMQELQVQPVSSSGANPTAANSAEASLGLINTRI